MRPALKGNVKMNQTEKQQLAAHVFRHEETEDGAKWIYKGEMQRDGVTTFGALQDGDRAAFDFPSEDSECELMEEASSFFSESQHLSAISPLPAKEIPRHLEPPWETAKIGKSRYGILSDGGLVICETREPETAHLIVRACNSHKKLVDALNEYLSAHNSKTICECWICDSTRAALALAEKGTK